MHQHFCCDAKFSMLFFSWLDIFCAFFIPMVCWSTSSNVKIKFIDAVVFPNSTNSFHPIFFLFFRTKVPGAFSTKKNILLSILCRKFSKLENMFFHFNVSDLGMNFIPRERTWIVAKFGKNIFERLWIPVGTTCFSKMFIGATSGE